jgi:UDP-N-acetylmuramoylalanine--D-glutamate ligase
MKIAIAGYGLEGEANYKYWAADPNNTLTIVDQHQPSHPIPPGALTIIGEDAFENLIGFDLIIRTAGLSPYKIHTNGKVWSATNEFLEKCPAIVIGVTGTKGKGTTASLIASIFEAAGKKVWLVGNIGISAIGVLPQIMPEDIVVFEMSSFQLWDVKRSPHTAVVLQIEPDHLNVHRDMNDYVQAKANIRKFQAPGEKCVYHPTNAYSRQIALSIGAEGAIKYDSPDDGGVYVDDGNFCQGEQIICSTDVLQLIGRHNIENACAAITVAKLYDISSDSIEQGLREFKGLPHRLELIRTLDGVDYYNDSFSSAPSATVAAIKSFTQGEVLIIGGVDKKADFTELTQTIVEHSNVKEILVIGTIKNELSEIFRKGGVTAHISVLEAKTMAEIVHIAKEKAVSGDVVILSPGCASFDMFKSFYDRGDQFREIVLGL